MILAGIDEDVMDEESYITNHLDESMMKAEQEGEIKDVAFFTRDKQKITGLSDETLGSILLDCGYSANATGEGWWNSYYASMRPEIKKKNKVQVLKSNGKKFRFGGGKVLPSNLNVFSRPKWSRAISLSFGQDPQCLEQAPSWT